MVKSVLGTNLSVLVCCAWDLAALVLEMSDVSLASLASLCTASSADDEAWRAVMRPMGILVAGTSADVTAAAPTPDPGFAFSCCRDFVKPLAGVGRGNIFLGA